MPYNKQSDLHLLFFFSCAAFFLPLKRGRGLGLLSAHFITVCVNPVRSLRSIVLCLHELSKEEEEAWTGEKIKKDDEDEEKPNKG